MFSSDNGKQNKKSCEILKNDDFKTYKTKDSLNLRKKNLSEDIWVDYAERDEKCSLTCYRSQSRFDSWRSSWRVGLKIRLVDATRVHDCDFVFEVERKGNLTGCFFEELLEC